MNLRQWARATHKKISGQPAELHHKQFSMTDVEMVLRQCIQVLTESLSCGDDLRLRDLGRLWVEEKPPSHVVSNLPDQKKRYDLEERKSCDFRHRPGWRFPSNPASRYQATTHAGIGETYINIRRMVR